MAPLFGLLLLMAPPAISNERSSGVAHDDSVACRHTGLVFSLGVEPHVSSITVNGGYLVSMSVGYLVTSQFSLACEFYTGDENVGKDFTRPVWGRCLVGGGGLVSKLVYARFGRVQPYAGLGYGLYTILLNEVGYNGGGVHFSLGIQVDLSDNFSASADASYTRARFYNTVGDADPRGVFEPFVDHLFGVRTSISFYPNILP